MFNRKIHLYIENEVFDSISKIFKQVKLDFEKDADQIRFYFDLNQLFKRNRDVEIKPLGELSKDNPRSKSVLKSTSKKAKPTSKSFDTNFFATINPHSIFFISESEKECNELAEKYGYVFISKDNIEKAKFLFSSNLVTINEENDTVDWNFIAQHKHPCNCMVVADNYLLSNSDKSELNQNAIITNVVEFLKCLIPSKLEIEFEIVFLTSKGEIKNLPVLYQRLNSKLLDFNRKIKLSIREVANLHDRHILTNLFLFTSGYGFVHKKDITTFTAFPITYPVNEVHIWQKQGEIKANSAWECYNNMLESYINAPINGKFGEIKNRLLNG